MQTTVNIKMKRKKSSYEKTCKLFQRGKCKYGQRVSLDTKVKPNNKNNNNNNNTNF